MVSLHWVSSHVGAFTGLEHLTSSALESWLEDELSWDSRVAGSFSFLLCSLGSTSIWLFHVVFLYGYSDFLHYFSELLERAVLPFQGLGSDRHTIIFVTFCNLLGQPGIIAIWDYVRVWVLCFVLYWGPSLDISYHNQFLAPPSPPVIIMSFRSRIYPPSFQDEDLAYRLGLGLLETSCIWSLNNSSSGGKTSEFKDSLWHSLIQWWGKDMALQ